MPLKQSLVARVKEFSFHASKTGGQPRPIRFCGSGVYSWALTTKFTNLRPIISLLWEQSWVGIFLKIQRKRTRSAIAPYFKRIDCVLFIFYFATSRVKISDKRSHFFPFSSSLFILSTPNLFSQKKIETFSLYNLVKYSTCGHTLFIVQPRFKHCFKRTSSWFSGDCSFIVTSVCGGTGLLYFGSSLFHDMKTKENVWYF